jgi:hypothetical protein
MSLKDVSCPGCTYSGTSHLESCPEASHNKYKDLVQGQGESVGQSTPPFISAMTQAKPEIVDIIQTIVPSGGTRLVCTRCGKTDWHTLVLRRKAGLLEGLCKQKDGSGCYPSSSRRNCQYSTSDNLDCQQLAEYTVAIGDERLNPRDACRDHIGEMLRQGPLYQIWPLED